MAVAAVEVPPRPLTPNDEVLKAFQQSYHDEDALAKEAAASPTINEVYSYFSQNAWAFTSEYLNNESFEIGGKTFEIGYGVIQDKEEGFAILKLYESGKSDQPIISRSWKVKMITPSKAEKFIWEAFVKYLEGNPYKYALAREASQSKELQKAYTFFYETDWTREADFVKRKDIEVGNKEMRVKWGILRAGKSGFACISVYEKDRKETPIIEKGIRI